MKSLIKLEQEFTDAARQMYKSGKSEETLIALLRLALNEQWRTDQVKKPYPKMECDITKRKI